MSYYSRTKKEKKKKGYLYNLLFDLARENPKAVVYQIPLSP